MTASDQELTIAEVEQYVQAHGNWYQHQSPESLEVRLARALLASQKALREIADFVMDSRTRGYDNDPRIADMAEAALLRLGEGENSDAS